jgi:ABC-type microcin C transport system duplicated ATPase subunit YejF
MASEFELLDDAMEDDDDWEDMTYASVLKSFESGLDNNEAVAIIEKYGWDKSTFGKKIMAISMGTGYLIVLDKIDEMPEEQGKNMADIYKKQYELLVHEDDLNLLKPRLPELEMYFTEE